MGKWALRKNHSLANYLLTLYRWDSMVRGVRVPTRFGKGKEMARMQTPQGEGWRKVPSVTTGGAAFFYARRNPSTDQREWFMYDRELKEWRYSDEDGHTITL